MLDVVFIFQMHARNTKQKKWPVCVRVRCVYVSHFKEYTATQMKNKLFGKENSFLNVLYIYRTFLRSYSPGLQCELSAEVFSHQAAFRIAVMEQKKKIKKMKLIRLSK